jgi:hypothetical protein
MWGTQRWYKIKRSETQGVCPLETLLIRQENSDIVPTHFRKKRGNGWGTMTVFRAFFLMV